MKYDYDMVAIGGGTSGLVSAGMSAVLGAKTLLIEAKKLGGDCTWHGCVPSKSLIRAARVAHQMRSAAQLGLTAADPEHDLGRVMARVHSIREQIYEQADAPPNMHKLGVEVRTGVTRFLDPHTIEIRENGRVEKLTSRYIVIATGSVPHMPEVEGAPGRILNNETLFDLDRLPRRLVILGAGPVGIEMAQAFRRLGSDVTVVNRGKGILAHDDVELTSLLLDHLRQEGIRFVFDAEVERIEKESVVLKNGEHLEAGQILSAIGRKSNIASLNLEAAGVRTDEKGIVIDRHCRSSVKHIYACGDVTGQYLFTHMAEHMAKTAVTNALLHFPSSIDQRHVTWCTFTDPELAHVGRSERDLIREGVAHSVYRFPFRKLDRAITESETTGMIKLLAGRSGRILGVSILGANAGEMIGEYAVAMRNGVSLSGISSTIHPYPTYGLGNQRAAGLYVTGKLTPGIVRWIQRIFRLRGSDRGIVALNAG